MSLPEDPSVDVGAGETIVGASIVVQARFGDGDDVPTLVHEWVDGVIRDVRMVPGAHDCQIRMTPDQWRRFREGSIDGEQMLFGATVDATWEQLLLLQGLYQGDAFRRHLRACDAR